MADGGPFGPASVVVFGLLAALSWGAADFGGGLASRRAASVFAVVLVSQVSGLVVAFALAILRGEPAPGQVDVAWSIVSGALGIVGILALYGGLAVGRMGVVAPVTGVLAATVPVLIGVALEGVPGAPVLAGIVLAIVAVVLVSRVPDASGGRSGLEFAVVAGVCLGLFNVTITRIDEALAFGPLTIVRAVNVVAVTIVILVARRSIAVPRSLLPAVLVIGVLDMGGNAGLVFAEQTGSLAVASVLTSLYPVTTVILAILVLHERVTRTHVAGIALAAAAIGLISWGSAT